MFKDKVLLITGGTGSFGSGLLGRLLNSDIGEIRIFSRDEKKQDDMRHRLQDSRVKLYIGDVRDMHSVDMAVKGADYIFHAAALKQVPSCEFFPSQAVSTNVQGTENILDAAIRHGVRSVVALSTDKACYPVNAMGMTKALMEKVAVAKARQLGPNAPTVICCIRYGNVMGSRGSVIPLWVNQIKEGKPITVTDTNMTRFMMTMDDAIDLAIYAFEHAAGGDIFVQKALSVTLQTLADALIRLYASDTKVRIIGTRHGEKLYETLVSREEMAKAEDMGGYYRIPCDPRDLNYEKYFEQGEKSISAVEDYHSHNTRLLDTEGITELLMQIDFIRKDTASC